MKQRAITEWPNSRNKTDENVTDGGLPGVKRMCCEGAPHGIKCDRSEKMVEVNGVCKLKQRELDSIPAESEDDEGDYEMERNVSVAVPQDPTIHGGAPSKNIELRATSDSENG